MPDQAADVTPETLLLSVPKAAELLGISFWMCRKLVMKGDLPSEMVGGRRYVAAAAVRDYAAKIAGQA